MSNYELVIDDGNWTIWSQWTVCSTTCDTGSQNRSRNCTNPVPWNGGYNCTGNATHIRKCFLKPCEGKILILYMSFTNYVNW